MQVLVRDSVRIGDSWLHSCEATAGAETAKDDGAIDFGLGGVGLDGNSTALASHCKFRNLTADGLYLTRAITC